MAREIPAERLLGLSDPHEGLSETAVHARQAQYGRNDILEVAVNPWLELTRDTLKDPMIWFLVITSLVYLILGETVEALTLLGAILPLVGMDAYLHRRTQASTQSLKGQLAQQARVMRAATFQSMPASALVPGDLVEVRAGESFPADGIVVQSDNAQVDESSLTGESIPVRKERLENSLSQSDRPLNNAHWGYAGTRLISGTCLSRIIYTGRETLYGEIVRSASLSDRARTPLQVAVGDLVTLLLVMAGMLCLMLAGIRLQQGHRWIDALISAATLAVAALPEEFPVVLTVFLGVGVYRLAKSKALVRRAVSVENMGRITCICTDKTGTVTLGQVQLEHVLAAPGHSTEQLLQLAALASRWETADPLDRAILERLAEHETVPLSGVTVASYPYTEHRRRESTVIQQPDRYLAATKGSPETLLAMADLSSQDRTKWLDEVDRLASAGHKVLVCLWWSFPSPYPGGEPDCRGTFAGLLAFEDPLRVGVPEAVQQCQQAGIRLIMVTGDHPATAKGIAYEMGLGDKAVGVVTGDELSDRLKQNRQESLVGVDVVARSLPMQKLALVQALQAQGEIVAVTGDGVNDVPALQAADIGIAMGERGTRSAREVASIVLLDDNFRSIVQAIAEGRQLFRNLQLSFQYLLMMHLPLVVAATFIPLTGHPLLFHPIHVVWLETIMHPTALLVFQELPTAGPLQAMPSRKKARLFAWGEWLLIATVGMLLTGLILWSYERSLLPEQDVMHARATAMAVLSCASAVLTTLLSGVRTKTALLTALLTVGVSCVLIQSPSLASWLQLKPLHGDDLAIAYLGACGAVVVPFLIWRAFSPKRVPRRVR